MLHCIIEEKIIEGLGTWIMDGGMMDGSQTENVIVKANQMRPIYTS